MTGSSAHCIVFIFLLKSFYDLRLDWECGENIMQGDPDFKISCRAHVLHVNDACVDMQRGYGMIFISERSRREKRGRGEYEWESPLPLPSAPLEEAATRCYFPPGHPRSFNVALSPAFHSCLCLACPGMPPTCSVNVWLQSRSLPARGRVGLEVHRCLRRNKDVSRINYT